MSELFGDRAIVPWGPASSHEPDRWAVVNRDAQVLSTGSYDACLAEVEDASDDELWELWRALEIADRPVRHTREGSR